MAVKRGAGKRYRPTAKERTRASGKAISAATRRQYKPLPKRKK